MLFLTEKKTIFKEDCKRNVAGSGIRRRASMDESMPCFTNCFHFMINVK
ncbi:hypothetical protein T05_10085 [Trichinella murrelli]|uniref:Uncharacterized protein n=1 Tax=Trichinella murrelli TaxID=144512 RepID=A0A0V0TG88_9BILA|nr:hypothetical protein T05_10085 [Trichinella murrelli]